MPAARGEKIVTSVPRSRWSLSCALSIDSRIWSSVMLIAPFARVLEGSLSSAICFCRNASSSFGAVV